MPSVLRVQVVNRTGFPASDLHIEFRGSGGDLGVDPESVTTDSDCQGARVPSNDLPTTNRVDIQWPSACVKPGAKVKFQAASSFGPLAVVSGYWTLKLPFFGEFWIGDVKPDDVSTTARKPRDADEKDVEFTPRELLEVVQRRMAHALRELEEHLREGA